jgi:hypothetical protein
MNGLSFDSGHFLVISVFQVPSACHVPSSLAPFSCWATTVSLSIGVFHLCGVLRGPKISLHMEEVASGHYTMIKCQSININLLIYI